MAGRRNKTTKRSRRSTRRDDGLPVGKSQAEARVERLTWFFLVAIFAVVQLLEGAVPPVVVPLAGAGILLGSALYQYSRHWRVSPVTWLAGALMAGLAYVNISINPDRNFIGLALLVFAGVILFGLLTGET